MPGVRAFLLVSVGLLFMATQAWAGAHSIGVEALLPGTAVLKIDGQRKTLRVGESHAGVTLVASTPMQATLTVDGQEHIVGISQHIGTRYEAPKEQLINIPRDARLQYQTTAMINGRSALVLVDTGANVVAMSSGQAAALGIDYKAGVSSSVETASGVSASYSLMLRSVSVGGIEVDNVRATVVEGDYPAIILLGMSYLRHVKLQEHNGVLSLSRTR